MNLLAVEMQRALRRRVVRVLIVMALLGCALAGVIAFVDSSGRTLAELTRGGEPHPAVLTDWWMAADADGAVVVASFFLLLGGLFAGASVAGAEWRAGTITTVLTWEPRRVRLHAARTAACGILAFVIAVALQVVFLAAFLPAVLANGSTAGASGGWWQAIAFAVLRTAALTALATVLSVSLATLGRNTAFALGAVFAWLVVVENLVRGLRPSWGGYLWAENIGTIVPWRQMEDAGFTRGPVLALATVVLYTALVAVAATISFGRRDIGGAT